MHNNELYKWQLEIANSDKRGTGKTWNTLSEPVIWRQSSQICLPGPPQSTNVPNGHSHLRIAKFIHQVPNGSLHIRTCVIMGATSGHRLCLIWFRNQLANDKIRFQTHHSQDIICHMDASWPCEYAGMLQQVFTALSICLTLWSISIP